MSSSAASDRPRAEPTPYELYIRLADLEALWPRAPEAQPGEVVLVCGFQAAELTLRLIDDALGDDRDVAFPEQRVKRYAEHLVSGVELVCDLLRSIPVAPLATRGSVAARAVGEPVSTGGTGSPSLGFRVLARVNRDLLDATSGRLLLAAAKLPFELGIEQQLERARREQGLEDCGGGARSR